jgi:hypothetical protein
MRTYRYHPRISAVYVHEHGAGPRLLGFFDKPGTNGRPGVKVARAIMTDAVGGKTARKFAAEFARDLGPNFLEKTQEEIRLWVRQAEERLQIADCRLRIEEREREKARRLELVEGMI